MVGILKQLSISFSTVQITHIKEKLFLKKLVISNIKRSLLNQNDSVIVETLLFGSTGLNDDENPFNPIQDGHFQGCLRMGVGKKPPLSLKFLKHILQWWNLAQLYLT